MSGDSAPDHGKWIFLGAVVTAIGAVVGAIFYSNPGLLTGGSDSTTVNDPSGSSATATSPAPGPAPREPVSRATFTHPTPNSRLPAEEAIDAAGTVDGLPAESSLWLLDSDSKSFAVDEEANVSGSQWTASSLPPYGDHEDTFPLKQTLVLVMADPRCDGALRNEMSEGDWALASLPAGCTRLGAVRIVIVR